MFDSPTGIEQIIPLVGDMNLDTEIIVGSQEVDDLVSQMRVRIEPDELVARDELFAKYHPELARARGHKDAACCASAPAQAATAPISYSPGCGCGAACAPVTAPAQADKPSDAVDADELKRMVEELVKAFRSIPE